MSFDLVKLGPVFYFLMASGFHVLFFGFLKEGACAGPLGVDLHLFLVGLTLVGVSLGNMASELLLGFELSSAE